MSAATLIESYSFGAMTVAGKTYRKDLIVLADRVLPEWWREEGHRLQASDLKSVFDSSPDVLIIGTGAFGRMEVPAALRKDLEGRFREVHYSPTGDAVRLFNRMAEGGRRVAGAFHLTC